MFKSLFGTRSINYVIVGLGATILDFFFLYLLVEKFHLHYLWGALISMSIVLWVSFTLNKYWTFKNFEKKYFQQFAKYAVSHAIALGVALIILTSIVEIFNFWYLFAKVFATGGAAIINFLLVDKFIFSEKKKLKPL